MAETRFFVSAVGRMLFFMACFFLAIWGNVVLDTNAEGKGSDVLDQEAQNGAMSDAVFNNGEEMIQVQGKIYYQEYGILCSDGKDLYFCNRGNIYRRGLDSGVFTLILAGELVDCNETGTILYYISEDHMLYAYNTEEGESRLICENLKGYVGRSDGILYVSRSVGKDYWVLNAIPEKGGSVSENILNHVFSEPVIGNFYVDEDYIFLSAGEYQGSMGNFLGYFYSYNRESKTLIRKMLTDDSDFVVTEEYLYYEKIEAGKGGRGVYRVRKDFTENTLIGEEYELLMPYGSLDGVLVWKQVDSDVGFMGDLVLLSPDGSEDQVLVDIHELLNTDSWKNISRTMILFDRMKYRHISVMGNTAYLKLSHQGSRGYGEVEVQSCWLKVHMDGSGYDFFQIPEEIQYWERLIRFEDVRRTVHLGTSGIYYWEKKSYMNRGTGISAHRIYYY